MSSLSRSLFTRPHTLRRPLRSRGPARPSLARADHRGSAAEPVSVSARARHDDTLPGSAGSASGDGHRDFVDLQAAYRDWGGLLPGAQIADRRPDGGIARLARSIADREALSVEWCATSWLPAFQFQTDDVGLRETPRRVIAELADALDGWSLALWFVQPNALLGGAVPLALLEVDPDAVIDAARACRFILRG